MNKNSSNVIIIIGNGFDLAHGLATSYGHFASYYLKEVIFKNLIKNPLNNNFFKEDFITDFKKLKYSTNAVVNLKEPVKYIACQLVYANKNIESEFATRALDHLNSNPEIISHIIANKLLGNLYKSPSDDWFDIETYYFELLKNIVSPTFAPLANSKKESAIELNSNLSEIKIALKDYLRNLSIIKTHHVSKFFTYNLSGKSRTYVVNFNYTKTFDFYKDQILNVLTKKKNIEINHIHGTLEENIVFGYGDDSSNDYKLLKNSGEDEYLKNFKTYHYLENYRYREIIDRIDEFRDYEVYILGHSLGKTDKTLLNEILSPEKCLNIHLFKRPDLSLEESLEQLKKLYYNLTRVLDNDSKARKKIIPDTLTPYFPYSEDDKKTILAKKKKLSPNQGSIKTKLY